MIAIYSKLKNFISENKSRFGLLLACSVIFAVGYGTGKSSVTPLYENSPKSNNSIFNYTTSKAGQANTLNKTNKNDNTNTTAKTTKKPAGDPTCPVKGNVTSAKEKKYYLPQDPGYAQVKPEECFATEQEAQEAGFFGASK